MRAYCIFLWVCFLTVMQLQAQPKVWKDTTVLNRNYINRSKFQNAFIADCLKNGCYLYQILEVNDHLYFIKGKQFQFAVVRNGLDSIFHEEIFKQDSLMTPNEIFSATEIWKRQMENEGFAFNNVTFEILSQENNTIYLSPKISLGNKVKLDSFLSEKNVLNSNFIRRMAGYKAGDFFSAEKNEQLKQRLHTLNIFSLGEIAIKPYEQNYGLYLSVSKRQRDRINGVLGLANNQNGKLQITGDIDLLANNLLGRGIRFGLNWQNFIPAGQELNSFISIPYLFGINTITEGKFSLQKFDTLFTTLNRGLFFYLPVKANGLFQLGVDYGNTNRIFIDVNEVKNNRALPANPSSHTIQYKLGFTYRNRWLEPFSIQGFEYHFSFGTGTRTIEKDPLLGDISWMGQNGERVFLYDSLEKIGLLKNTIYSFQMQSRHFFPVNSMSTILWSNSVVWNQWPQVYFSDLARFGGIKNIRGFNEQSIFANKFALTGLEYRFILGNSAHIGPAIQFAWAENDYALSNLKKNWYFSTSLVAGLKTGLGIFQFVWALGRDSNLGFNFNNSKFHFGLSNQF